jgi:LPXTG-site transpeptidase (sortase) family protein
VPGSFIFTRTAGTLLQPPTFNYNSATATLTFVWDEFQLAQGAHLEFQATFVGPSPVQNTATAEWTSLEIDPSTTQRSTYNPSSTERWYDPLSTGGLDDYGVTDSVSLHVTRKLPMTGFAPGVVTQLPAMPADLAYSQTDLMLEVPRLGVQLTIVGVPFGKENWDLTWLGENAGWLEGSAYPTHSGNSALTAHAYLADGTAGPFAKLSSLRYGDQIIVHLGGQNYIYEVRENLRVGSNGVSVLKHEELPWLTLITCQTYSEGLGDYIYRVAIRAVLIKVE